MNTVLQLATVPDLDIILPLMRSYHDFEQVKSTEAQRESAARKLLMNAHLGSIWLIYCNEQLAGYIALCRGFSLEFGGVDAFVDEFYLNADYRGKGIGTQTLEIIKTEAKKHDINALHLEVARGNTTARSLYQKAGFESREKYVLMSVML